MHLLIRSKWSLKRIQTNILVSALFVEFSFVDPSVVLATDASCAMTETET